ncbi:hypothetical protein CF319_g4462 [Tilletia indica]|nr:hypothetical protein CF319_g4462 [Tilletia indica]
MRGIHSFNAPARSGVAGRRLPQFSMQPAPRARGTPSTTGATSHSAAAVPSRMSKSTPRKEGPRSSYPPAARRVLAPQTQHQQRHAIISRRPKKIFASVTSAAYGFSNDDKVEIVVLVGFGQGSVTSKPHLSSTTNRHPRRAPRVIVNSFGQGTISLLLTMSVKKIQKAILVPPRHSLVTLVT